MPTGDSEQNVVVRLTGSYSQTSHVEFGTEHITYLLSYLNTFRCRCTGAVQVLSKSEGSSDKKENKFFKFFVKFETQLAYLPTYSTT